MKKSNFVVYEVTMEKKVKKGNAEERVPMMFSGVIENTPHIIGKIFQRHPEALECCSIVEEIYTPIYT